MATHKLDFALPSLLLAGSFFLAPALRAEIGDNPGESEQGLPATWHKTVEPARSPEEELKSFQLPPGFHMELVAAEPLVHDPVAAAYDWQGNLWVVEYSNYNMGMIKDLPALTKGVAESEVQSGKIVKLESTHHDGHYDKRTVWLDGLERPRGIAIVHDGILISDTPHLWLARDLHGSGKCDDKKLVADNYEAWEDSEESGSLMWGRDNILHDIDFAYDYRYSRGEAQRIAVPVRGQFGISQDDYGRIFSNRNSDQLFCDLYAPTYGLRDPGVTDTPWDFVRIAQDQETWPIHMTPAINRGYRRGVLGQSTGGLRDDGTLLEFTAACGPLVYRGANFPGRYYNNAFVCEPSANLVHRDLVLEGDGQMTAISAERGREFLASDDTRFRPVALLNSPDGSMTVVDLYRGILQEYHYITSYIRDQSLGRGLETPAFGQGRLWKVVYDGGKLDSTQPNLATMSAEQLAGLLTNPNAWWRDSAEQELVERADKSAVPTLQAMARNAPSEVTRVYALWTLDGLGATTPEFLAQVLKDPAPKVRAAAVRLHERWLGGDEADAIVQQLGSVLHDPESEVSVQLALTLGEAHTASAVAMLNQILLISGSHPFVPKAIASGLNGREIDFFRLLTSEADTVGPRPEVRSLLSILATAIVHRGDRALDSELIAKASDGGGLPEWARLSVIDGFEALGTPAFRRQVGAAKLVTSDDVAPWVASADASVSAAAKQLIVDLSRQERLARERAANAKPLNAEEKRYYKAGKATFQICAACHQPTGTGLPNVAPSLVDSHWVTSDPEILVRILQNGKEGTPGFPGAMPTIASSFSDDTIAGVLTYIRNSWELHAGAVSPETVARIRKEIGHRQAAWTDAELKEVEASLANSNRQH